MNRLLDFVRLKVIPNFPKWAPLLILGIGLLSLPILFILILNVSTSRPHVEPLKVDVPASSGSLAANSTLSNQSAKIAPNLAASPSGNTCSEIATSGNMNLNAINSEISQILSQAHQSAAAGNYSESVTTVRSANALSLQGASEQKKYVLDLQSHHCSTQYLAQLTK